MKRRPLLSGKKKPTEIPSLSSKNTKPNSLLDHTSKIVLIFLLRNKNL